MTSPALWPASATSASDPAHNPAAISTTTNTTLSTTPQPMARSIPPGGSA